MSEGNGVLLQVPVSFGSVGLAKTQVSVGISIDAARVTREQMGDLFVGRVLGVVLTTGDPDQPPLPGLEDEELVIKGQFTAKSYSEGEAGYTTRLAIPKSEARSMSEEFWDIGGRGGWLTVTSAAEPDSSHQPLDGQQLLPHPDVEAGKDRPHSGQTLAAVHELRSKPIPKSKGGLTKPQRQLLAASNITTLGGLSDLVAKGVAKAAVILGVGAGEAEAVLERAKVHLTQPLPDPPEPPRAVREAVPDIDKAETFLVPMPDNIKHQATVTVAPIKGGSWWAAGWTWKGDGRDGQLAADDENALIRKTKGEAMAAAAGQLVDSIQGAEEPESQAARDRRARAINACKTFYGEAERGGQTIFDVGKAR